MKRAKVADAVWLRRHSSTIAPRFLTPLAYKRVTRSGRIAPRLSGIRIHMDLLAHACAELLLGDVPHAQVVVAGSVNRERKSAASKCSNRSARHRPYVTVIGLLPAPMTSIDRVGPKW